MSKDNSKSKKIIAIVVILIIILILVPIIYFVRNMCIVNKILDNMAKNNEITNIQYIEKNITSEGEAQATLYIKDEKTKISSFADIYLNYEGDTYFVNKESKEYVVGGRELTENMIMPDGKLSAGVYREASFKDRVELALKWEIKDDEVNGEKCYYLVIDGIEYWISKDTYFIIKQKENNGIIYEWNDIKVDTVTDEMMALPDFSDYTVTKVGNENDIENTEDT